MSDKLQFVDAAGNEKSAALIDKLRVVGHFVRSGAANPIVVN
jgi:hypothetical protein